jgi:hypothetical protein
MVINTHHFTIPEHASEQPNIQGNFPRRNYISSRSRLARQTGRRAEPTCIVVRLLNEYVGRAAWGRTGTAWGD